MVSGIIVGAKSVNGRLLIAGALLVALLMVSALIVPGCGEPEHSLRVGTSVWPGYEPLFLAESLGYYDGQNIELITFPTSAENMRAYRNQAIDVAALTADEALQISETLPGQRIALVMDFSNGADAILAQPRFKTMQDLRGHRIGVEQNALGAYMLSRALTKSGMSSRDVVVVPVPLGEHESAFKSNKVDAVVTFEPRCSRLIAAGANVVFDSSQIPEEIVDVLLVRPGLDKQQDGQVKALIDGSFRALDYLHEQPQDAARRVAAREQVTPEAFLESLKGLQLPDRTANQRLLGDSPENLDSALRRLHSLMLENGLLTRADELAVLLDDRFVREITP